MKVSKTITTFKLIHQLGKANVEILLNALCLKNKFLQVTEASVKR